MKKILLIYTGGTFGMVPISPDRTLAPGDLTSIIARHVPEIHSIADITTEIIYNLDSSNIHIPHWVHLTKCIEQRIDDFDGFVIIHGTDAMTFAATALSFMLQNLPKPVIFTGSQKPIAEIRSDARHNLINSVELAGLKIPEVGILFNNYLFRANRVLKGSSTLFDAFVSPNYAPLAEIGLDIELKGTIRKNQGFFRVQHQFDDRVMVIKIFPGLRPEYLGPLLETDIRGLVIEAYGLGTVPVIEKTLIPFIQAAVAKGIIVVITSQVPHGYVDLKRYESGVELLEAGAISAFDMTATASIVKLMFVLGHSTHRETIERSFQTPIAGEMKESKTG